VPDRPVRLILDASAIVAFVRESVHVGEVIAQVDAEEAAVGLPVLCLAQAKTMVDDVDRLNLLAGHDAAVVLSDPDDWQALAATVDLVGRWDAAAAALLALDSSLAVLTATPALYAGLGGGDLTIAI
jgi:hypothetical protein